MNILTRRFTTALACASLLGLASAPQAVLAADPQREDSSPVRDSNLCRRNHYAERFRQ